MWFLLQLSVALAVLFSDAAWHWSNNGYVTGLLAAYAAYAATCLIYSLRNWRSELVPRYFHQRFKERAPASRVTQKSLGE